MLDQETKQRILEEETYRLEVRRQLEGQEQSRWKNLWPILNGAFSLWILSTVFVGLITWGYQSWKESREKVQQTERIRLEVTVRAASFHDLLGNASDLPGLQSALQQLDGSGASVFPEFRGRSLNSLLYELRSVAGQPALKQQASEALNASLEIGALFSDLDEPVDPVVLRNRIEAIDRDTFEKLELFSEEDLQHER